MFSRSSRKSTITASPTLNPAAGGGSGPTDTEPTSDPALDRIAELWEFVYRGLYKSHPKLYSYRYELLVALADAAGASPLPPHNTSTAGVHRTLQPLQKTIFNGTKQAAHSPADTSFEHLRIHKSSSKDLKEATIEILEAYAEEVERVDEIEHILRERQVGFRAPEAEDWEGAWKAIEGIVEATGRKLMHYHFKMRVLQMDIEKDVLIRELPTTGKGVEWWLVPREILYPPRGGKSSSFMTSSMY